MQQKLINRKEIKNGKDFEKKITKNNPTIFLNAIKSNKIQKIVKKK